MPGPLEEHAPDKLNQTTQKARARKPMNLLLVDIKPELESAVEQITARHESVRVTRCRTLAEARARLENGPVDLVVVHDELTDGSGVELATELDRSRRITKTIVVSDQATADGAIRAIRAGASDFVVQTHELFETLSDLEGRLVRLINRQKYDKRKAQRVRRLRRVCRKLNEARAEVSEQVEVLCHDLVTAYQELAEQVQDITHHSTFGTQIEEELDFEALLRCTLEYLIEQAGASNAAIYLPATMDEYSLGGYVNYDCGSDAADMLLPHLGDVVAPRVAECHDLITVTDNQTMQHWLGQDASWLEDCHLVGVTCRHEDDVMAVIILFRDGGTPFDDQAGQTLTSIAPMLGEALAKVIRVHHRAADFEPGENQWGLSFDEDDEDVLPF